MKGEKYLERKRERERERERYRDDTFSAVFSLLCKVVFFDGFTKSLHNLRMLGRVVLSNVAVF